MKLDCILTATNDNPLYQDFITLFIKSWSKLYHNIDVKVILISDIIPDKIKEYTNNIILFKPIDGISSAFVSQYIRLLYPCILDYNNSIMITYIDMIPLNNTYYTKNIEKYDNSKFIYLRNVLLDQKQIAMCYNVATNYVWRSIFNIYSIEDIVFKLTNKFYSIHYVDGPGKSGWSTDQLDLYSEIMNWKKKSTDFIIMDDRLTGFKRLNRNTFNLNNDIKNKISSGYFIDYHCYRPYS